MRESSVVTPVLKWWRAKGFLAVKLSDKSSAGQPDWLFIGPNSKVAFIEFKAPGGKPSDLQMKWIGLLRELGYPVEVFDNTELAQRWLKEQLL